MAVCWRFTTSDSIPSFGLKKPIFGFGFNKTSQRSRDRWNFFIFVPVYV
jgi:hypothetical protein